MKTKQKTRAQLQRENLELHAQLVHRHHTADYNIDKASTERMFGSAVILQLTGLGGKEIVEPIAIRDGLSNDTIEALRRDIERSWKVTTEMKPKGVQS